MARSDVADSRTGKAIGNVEEGDEGTSIALPRFAGSTT
jgi:hypothetical protein